MRPGGLRPLLSKRVLGWLSWQLRRRRRYRPSVLEALLADLEQTAPDQLAITGDLTNVALESEFPAAAAWLERFGPPERVSAVPGNHDAYVAVPRARGTGLWSDYLASDAEAQVLLPAVPECFPSLRLREPLALVGLCSARPTPPFLASGRVGTGQLRRLEDLLEALGRTGLCRVVLVHHVPEPGVVSARRALRDASQLCDVLRRVGAELVLHGHLHRARVAHLDGPRDPIPLVGVPSASHGGPSSERRAAYHLYDIEVRPPHSPRIRMRSRSFDPGSGCFRPSGPTGGRILAA